MGTLIQGTACSLYRGNWPAIQGVLNHNENEVD